MTSFCFGELLCHPSRVFPLLYDSLPIVMSALRISKMRLTTKNKELPQSVVYERIQDSIPETAIRFLFIKFIIRKIMRLT
jgi:hypothetical protein